MEMYEYKISVWKETPLNMRYDSLTDWQWFKDDHLIIKYIDLGDPDMNHMLITHEVQEALMCRLMGVSEKDVDAFDIEFEAGRPNDDFTSEPGDDPRAPYHKAHTTAELIERALALTLHISWGNYMDVCEQKFAMVKRVRKQVGIKD